MGCGDDGSSGSNGANGQDGTNGADGQDGADGRDGVDGKDGKDGANWNDGLETVVYGRYTIENSIDIRLLKGITEFAEDASYLDIDGREQLPNLKGLESLTTVDDMRIDSMRSLEGLEGLTTVTGHLDIGENGYLTSLTGLDSLTSVDRLSIQFNPNLCQSEAEALAADLGVSCYCTTNKDC